jgi:arylsulfatase A-like enzyme
LPAGAAALALALVGCRDAVPAHEPHRGPIVLVTVDALRADMVGALGGPQRLTPHFDALAAEASWAGRAVAPSSWTVPSMAALFTGLQPWSVQNRAVADATVAEELETLPESLKALGFRTTGFRSNVWLQPSFGYAQGFDELRTIGEGRRAENALAALDGSAHFVWAHVLPPHAPYVLREPLLPQLPEVPQDLPKRVRPVDFEPWFDPAVAASPEELRRLRAMYQLNVAWADQLLGRLLAALRRSGQWEDALLVVTSDHGEEFEEQGQTGHGGNLGRQLVEVPLAIKLPSGWKGPALALARGERPGTVRLRSTLVEAAGGAPAPSTARSLFAAAGDGDGVLSELYLGNGVNRVSWIEGDEQVVLESRFAPAEPEFYRARLASLGGAASPPPSESFDALFSRLERAFAAAPPLSGRAGDPPTLALWRWTAGGAERVEDPGRAKALARRLRTAWKAANGPDAPTRRGTGSGRALTPEEEAEMKALGYAGG